MSLIISPYSYLFSEDNKYYVFNSESCFLSEISKKIYYIIQDREYELLEEDDRSLLKNKKVLIDFENINLFFQESKFKYELSSFNTDVLNLIVVPTLLCNFSCSYCFELYKRNKTMDKKIIDNLITFIQEHERAKKIHLTWYGGEPLVAFRVIKEINLEIKNKIKIPVVSQSLVTNGYLLTNEIIEYFKEQQIKSIQITLDGKEDTHNKTRKLHSGEGSFTKIIYNIDNVVNKLTDCQIIVRVNINNENANEYIDLYNELSKRWLSKNIHIYPGFIREETKDSKSLCSKCIGPDSVINLYEYFNRLGTDIKYYPERLEKGCMINSLNSYIIGPEGEIYKCWNDVSNREKIIGFIDKKEIINKPLFYSYMMELSPFLDENCKKCNLLPICTGGCGWYRYKNKFENGEFNICSMYKGENQLKKALLSLVR